MVLLSVTRRRSPGHAVPMWGACTVHSTHRAMVGAGPPQMKSVSYCAKALPTSASGTGLVPPPQPGMIYGTPGRSLDGRFQAKAGALAAGGAGELATADVLGQFEAAHHELAVLHSLRVPAQKMHADIDHVVVAGRRVWLLDSKCWAPGFYWSIGALSMRALHTAPYAKRRTMLATARVVQGYLGALASVEPPIVVVWPSSDNISVWTWRPLDAKPITGNRLAAVAGRIIKPAPANPEVVEALAQLVL